MPVSIGEIMIPVSASRTRIVRNNATNQLPHGMHARAPVMDRDSFNLCTRSASWLLWSDIDIGFHSMPRWGTLRYRHVVQRERRFFLFYFIYVFRGERGFSTFEGEGGGGGMNVCCGGIAE